MKDNKYIHQDRIKKYKLFLFGLLFLFFAILLFLFYISYVREKHKLFFLFNGLYEYKLNEYASYFGSITIIFLSLFLLKNSILKILAFFSALCLSWLLLLAGSFYFEPKYYYFNSPDNSNILIFEETGRLFSGDCYAYTRKNKLFIKPAGFLTDLSDKEGSGYMADNRYTLIWLDNKTVSFTYIHGKELEKTDTVIINVE